MTPGLWWMWAGLTVLFMLLSFTTGLDALDRKGPVWCTVWALVWLVINGIIAGLILVAWWGFSTLFQALIR